MRDQRKSYVVESMMCGGITSAESERILRIMVVRHVQNQLKLGKYHSCISPDTSKAVMDSHWHNPKLFGSIHS